MIIDGYLPEGYYNPISSGNLSAVKDEPNSLTPTSGRYNSIISKFLLY